MADDSSATMTYREAVDRIPDRELPEFWIGSREALAAQLDSLERGRVEEVTTSPGGRPIRLVTYGDRPERDQEANFNSAVAGKRPAAYANRDERETPVVFFIGPVHGHEVEGLTGLCNLLSIVETGRDLRGTEQPTIRELADQCRLVVLPCGNPDGLDRFEPESLHGMALADLEFWGQGTWADDRSIGYPDAKQRHPMTGDDVGFLGCYFDDAGVNPMHDEFFDPMGPEAPAILDVARREAPDLTVSLHSHGYPPGLIRPKYVPLEVQADARAIHREYNARLDDLEIPQIYASEVASESGSPPPYFNLVSAAYHVSGTIGLLHESAHGLSDGYTGEITHEEILDAQLALYEVMLRHATDDSGP
ncbi:M14 family zinc carboxypeptidase [Natrononativus amylolyticus]|uniref:M14 family zinc carboxypeptidase n=1 Tax=Natrononativus amylolyticus TaxID=2963434 RepID=UPI0020CBD833|nr:M14 family zinc carboxypeptidase [Natrononativus amylolyticus]